MLLKVFFYEVTVGAHWLSKLVVATLNVPRCDDKRAIADSRDCPAREGCGKAD